MVLDIEVSRAYENDVMLPVVMLYQEDDRRNQVMGVHVDDIPELIKKLEEEYNRKA